MPHDGKFNGRPSSGGPNGRRGAAGSAGGADGRGTRTGPKRPFASRRPPVPGSTEWPKGPREPSLGTRQAGEATPELVPRVAPRSSEREKFIVREVRIMHEDADFLVVEKPSGMLSASLPGQKVKDPTLFDLVKRHVNARSKMKRRAWIIHRLDKETSGLVVFAKSERGFAWLKEELRAKRVGRVYVAVVEGVFEQVSSGAVHLAPAGDIAAIQPAASPTTPVLRRQLPIGTIQSYLYEDQHGLMRSTQSPTTLGKGRSDDDEADTDAKLAVTHFRVMEQAYGKSLVQVRLETGRKNQIRVHMQEIMHPVVGDRRYGATTDPIERVCLHASELSFTHPGNGKELRFFSQPPVAFLKLVGKKGEEARGAGEDIPKAESSTAPATTPSPTRSIPLATGPATSEKGREQPKVIVPAAPKASAKIAAVAVPKKSPAAEAPSAAKPDASSWEHVAGWYDDLIEERGSDHHDNVIIPGTLRLLSAEPGQRVLDVACGQGAFCRKLASLGVKALGVDASPSLIAAAERASAAPRGGRGDAGAAFKVGDARDIGSLGLKELDAATCLMALMNINPLDSVVRGVADVLRVGGRCVAVVLHPAFRSPGQTSWEWDRAEDPAPSREREENRGSTRPAPRGKAGKAFAQYRRVDGYLSPGVRDIVMNPGAVAKGKQPVTTQTFHRPIQAYVNAFARAGLLVDALEEWPSIRVSEPGPRAAAENRARREIPMFLAIRGVKLR